LNTKLYPNPSHEQVGHAVAESHLDEATGEEDGKRDKPRNLVPEGRCIG